ncbi:MAG TPA: ABC transporter permease [Planctomycetota bacterium]|nr:ABC transporter permease [Planctomycetota bacterium]
MTLPTPTALSASAHPAAPVSPATPVDGPADASSGPLGRTSAIAWALAIRDLRSRYTRSQLGAILTVLQPVLWLTTAVLAFWFLMGAGHDRDNTHSWITYAARTAAALAAWLPIAECWGRAPSAFQAQAPLIRRTRFPFLAIPLALVAAAGVTGMISFVLALVLLPFAGGAEPLTLTSAAAAGMGLTLLWAAAGAVALSAVGVFFRDLTSLIGHFLTLGMLITPIYYDPSIVPPAYQWAIQLNPLAAPANLLRTAAGSTPPQSVWLCGLYSAALGVLVLWVGLALLKRLAAKIPEQL